MDKVFPYREDVKGGFFFHLSNDIRSIELIKHCNKHIDKLK